jgi:Cof subfamily protein (haloacid dehalogenase superfamily)
MNKVMKDIRFIPLKYLGTCVSDLDGTLLPHNGEISAGNLAMLEELRQSGICRVLATGRSLFSLQKVIPPDAPFDYVIFATGAGIMDWQSKELIYSQNLNERQILLASKVLDELKLDYMIHKEVPDTHIMHYKAFGENPDFLDRVGIYREFATELDPSARPSWISATQFLAIVPEQRQEVYPLLQKRLAPLTTIRTTSPLDFSSLWIEIFAPGVNKGDGLLRLLTMLGLSLQQTMVIGNDYNDLHMLEICSNAFVTANAPDDLKAQFRAVASCAEDGFRQAAELWIQALQPDLNK